MQKKPYQDAVATIKEIGKYSRTLALQQFDKLEKKFPKADKLDGDFLKTIYECKKQILAFRALDDFDAYCRYLEWEREPSKRFYMPRRKQLRPLAKAMQRLVAYDQPDELDILCISLPPGVGKTTLALFFLSWVAGKYPDKAMLTSSHNNDFLRGAYDEILRIMSPDGEYLWNDVFPNLGIPRTDAKNMKIDIGTPKRFVTYQFSSVGSGNAGKVRAQSLLYCDDLVSGIDQAMSPEQLEKLYNAYKIDLRQRKEGNCKELHIATRWSVHDVIGRIEENNIDNPRAMFIRVPALDENEQSNFNYGYGVGYTNEFYYDMRNTMDDISWQALYMNQPIEREGLLYPIESLIRFENLPEREPDAIIAVCDTKDKGSDYCVLLVGKVYGKEVYIVDCVCDDGDIINIQPRLADILVRNKVQCCRFESNAAGGVIAENIKNMVQGYKIEIDKKYTTANKETKIITNSPFVKNHFHFKQNGMYASKSDYGEMMKWMTRYTLKGRNAHDDVPDAMAMLVQYLEIFNIAKIEVFRRPF